jgi:hypothetical protein
VSREPIVGRHQSPSRVTSCPDCDAEMQHVTERGVEVLRCPWTKAGQAGACGKPYKRDVYMARPM